MAAGIPGVGIGGLFYVLSAVAAPVRESYRAFARAYSVGGRANDRAPLWTQAFRLSAMAGGILVAMWLTGLLVGNLMQAITAPHPATPGAPLRASASIWKISALMLSVGTLTLVLGAVQIARLTLSGARVRAGMAIDRSIIMLLLAALTLGVSTPVGAQSSNAAALRSRADAVYASGDRAASERAYEAVLAVAPNDSRALFRLAGLRADAGAKVALLQRYVALEPGDAWGWLALADALTADGQHQAADAALSRAERVAPSERDVVFARTRSLQRAGRLDAAITRYELQTAANPSDEEAWQGLAEQRRRAGRLPEAIDALERAQALHATTRRASQLTAWKHDTHVQIEPAVVLTRDSDANVTRRAGVNVRLPLVGRAAVSVAASALQASNADLFPGTPSAQSASLGAVWRPRAAFSAEANVGLTQGAAPSTTVTTTTTTGPQRRPRVITATSTQSNAYTTPTGFVRLRWRGVAGGPSLDVRAARTVLDATPELLANRVVRTEGGVAVDLPLVAGFRGRAQGRAAAINTREEPENTRTTFGGALVRPVGNWGDIALNAQRIRVARATTQGYFAPRSADIAEVSTYVERESERGVVLAIDAGVGMQRMQAFDAAATSTWQPAARLWSHLDVPLARTFLLRTEVDLYDGGVARDAATAAHWRWISASLGVRITP